MKTRQGFTMIELIVVMAIIAIVATITALNLRPLGNDLQNAAAEVVGNLKQVRAKAMSTTSAYRLVYNSPTQITTQWANNCGADESEWANDNRLRFELREGVKFTQPPASMTPGTVLTCFSSRGLSTQNLELTLREKGSRTQNIEVFLGGSVSLQ